MKKILQEWKKWLMETSPTEKYLGQPGYPRNNPHDRAVPDTLRQGDMRSTFKAVLKNFMYNSQAFGQVENLIAKLSDDEKGKLVKDLHVMRHIYAGRTPYEIMDTDNVGTGIIFDDSPKVSGSPVEKIDAVLEDIGFQMEQSVPSDVDIEEVYIYYIKPNYQTTTAPQQAKKPNRFASQMSWSADKLAQMNKDSWLKRKK